MAYTITRADAYAISYDNAVQDGMPVARARKKTYTRLGVDGYGVVVTGSGGQKFSLTIESYFASYALAVAWGTAVGLLPDGLVTIVTPRGTWAGCTIESMSPPDVIAGVPYSRCRITMQGVIP